MSLFNSLFLSYFQQIGFLFGIMNPRVILVIILFVLGILNQIKVKGQLFSIVSRDQFPKNVTQ